MRGRRECLCGEPVLTGDQIVKRWGQWIHLACYRKLRELKASIAASG